MKPAESQPSSTPVRLVPSVGFYSLWLLISSTCVPHSYVRTVSSGDIFPRVPRPALPPFRFLSNFGHERFLPVDSKFYPQSRNFIDVG